MVELQDFLVRICDVLQAKSLFSFGMWCARQFKLLILFVQVVQFLCVPENERFSKRNGRATATFLGCPARSSYLKLLEKVGLPIAFVCLSVYQTVFCALKST